MDAANEIGEPLSPLDLTTCDQEPIHIPGSIQPHGVLFALSGPDLRITAVSANVATHLGREPSTLLNTPLDQILHQPSLEALRPALGHAGETTLRLAELHLQGASATMWRAIVHSTPTGVILEALLPQPDSPSYGAGGQFDQFERATRSLRAAKDVTSICASLAAEVRRLTGYDRVKVYRFAADNSGEVLAEDNSGRLPSYLGLRFPASDIPAQARALYILNPEREIPDISYTPVPLIQASPAPIDLSQATLRSVSAVHIEYLRNMAVGASMSISILRGGALWGLVACHHHTAHYVAPELRQASVLLGQLAAWQLGFVENAETARRGAGVKAIETILLREANAGQDYRETLLRNGDVLLDLVRASGFALSSGGAVTTLGTVPAEDDLPRLLDWLSLQGSDVFATDQLALDYPAGAALTGAAGVLAVPLGGVPQNLIVWFRPEIARTVKWAGDPAKPVDVRPGLERLTPRRSFEIWTEDVRGRSLPWEPHEVAAANGLRDMIVDIILRRSQELEQINAELSRSNEELEAFAFVASHDLREPLRQIETFSSLLQRTLGDDVPPGSNVIGWFEGIQASSKRMRTLINDLAEYARLGRHAQPFTPTDLNDTVKTVCADLDTIIGETQASVLYDDLPVVMCDRTQMRQVLQNLIANAIKYRHPERSPVITISASIRPSKPGPRMTLPIMEIIIADNGIGFEARHVERIFEPFQRLHSADQYEGSGIGLATCRKIINRHGGTITAAGQPGVGAVFTIALPCRPLPGANGGDT
jgi:light-regulated signal transduction histidine kinase (bacteriophytochrome)